jgi:NTE family protein
MGFRQKGLLARPVRGEISQAAAKSKPWLPALAGLWLLLGCQTSQVPMNQPLTAPRNEGYRLVEMNHTAGREDLVVLVAFSGGGKRSAAFGHGVLRGMRQVPVRLGGPDSTLLAELDQLSGVSGGSFPAAHYGLNRERSFESFPQEFLYQDIDGYIFGTFLLPWNWEWLVNPFYGTNDRMAEVYDRLMFHGATFADLARRGRPQVSINATDIAYGVPFSFAPPSFDLLCSDFGAFPVARAVAASNGFPVLFTPITLRNYRGPDCKAPPPLLPDPALVRSNLRARQFAKSLARYSDGQRTRWVHLMDGGIADNLALRPLLNSMSLLEALARQYGEFLKPVRRILVISVDGESAADPELPRQRIVTGLTQIFNAVSGTQIDAYNAETLILAEAEIARVVEAVKSLRCSQGPMLDGHRCDDVQGLLTHISLSDYPGEARARLQAIPTGLSIDRADVDLLVQAGESMVREIEPLRQFLAPEGQALTAPGIRPSAAAAAWQAPRRRAR